MYLRRRHYIKHRIQVPIITAPVCVSAFIRLKSESKQTKISALQSSAFQLAPPQIKKHLKKPGLYSCSYPPITNQPAWVTKGTRRVTMAHLSEQSITAQQTSATGNPPIISPLSHRSQRPCISQNPHYSKQSYFGSAFQSLFKMQDKRMTVAAWGHRSFEKCLNSQPPNFEF